MSLLLMLACAGCKGEASRHTTADAAEAQYRFLEERFGDALGKGRSISDYDSILTKVQSIELSELLQGYHAKTHRQIVVVTVNDIAPYPTIHRMATEVGQYWGVGDAKKNNGLVIILCKPWQKVGIATGTGTEKVLTDKICKRVIDSIMVPEFREGRFFAGLGKGIRHLMIKWDGASPIEKPSGSGTIAF